MTTDLLVLARDPLFRGGGSAATEAFLAAARELGREPELVFDPHPGLRGPRRTWRRIEAARQLAFARRRLPPVRELWVVSTHALEGGPAARGGRAYRCWIGTTVDAEWRGRAPGLPRARRAAAAASLRPLRRLERRVLERAERVWATSGSSRSDLAEASGRDDVGGLPVPADVGRFVPAAPWPPAEATLVVRGRGH